MRRSCLRFMERRLKARAEDPPPSDLSVGDYVFLRVPPRPMSVRKDGGTEAPSTAAVSARLSSCADPRLLRVASLARNTGESGVFREHGRREESWIRTAGACVEAHLLWARRLGGVDGWIVGIGGAPHRPGGYAQSLRGDAPDSGRPCADAVPRGIRARWPLRLHVGRAAQLSEGRHAPCISPLVGLSAVCRR